ARNASTSKKKSLSPDGVKFGGVPEMIRSYKRMGLSFDALIPPTSGVIISITSKLTSSESGGDAFT
nr:hypothetical protein [Tanacetum cinerariifolium]